MAQHREGNVGDCDVGTQAGCHECGVSSHHSCTEDQHLCGLHSGDTSKEHAPAPLRLFKEAASFLHRHAPGHLAHGDEQRQLAVGEAHRLVGYAHCPRLDHGFGQLSVAGEMEVGENHLVLADEGVFRGNRFFHLYNHLGDGIDIFYRGEDFSPGFAVFIVGEARAVAGCCLHIHPMAVCHQFTHSRWGYRHAVLVVFDFFGNSDNHVA